MEESRESPPAEHGFYMPAEWEPHAQTWIGWPVSLSLSLLSLLPMCKDSLETESLFSNFNTQPSFQYLILFSICILFVVYLDLICCV